MNQKKSFIEKIVDLLLVNPLRTFLIGLLFFACMLPGLHDLKTDFSYRIWFRSQDPMLQKFDAFERRFGSDEVLAVIVHSPSGIFDSDSSQLLIDLTRDLWTVPEVIRVDSLSNYQWVHASGDDIQIEDLIPEEFTESLLAERKAVALHHEIIPGYLVSQDAESSVIYATLKPAIGGTPDYDRVINGTRLLLEKYKSRTDHQFFISGSPAVNHSFKESTQHDSKILIPAIILITCVFLFFTFRTVSGIVLPLMVVLLASVMTLGFAGWVGIHMNNMTSITPQFLIAMGIADSTHILMSFFRYRSQGLEKKEAVRESLVKNFQGVLLTSLSTAMGLFSFVTAPIVPVAELGILTGTGTLFALVLTLLFLGPLILLLPIESKLKVTEEIDQPSAFSLKVTHFINNFRKQILLITAIISTGCLVLSLQNRINSDPFKYFSKDFFLTVATDFMEKHIGGAVAAEMVIEAGEAEGIKDPAFLKRVEELQNWISTQPHITKTISLVDIIKQMNRSFHGDQQNQYALPDSREAIAQLIFLYTMSLPQGMNLNDKMTIQNDALRLTVRTDIHDSERFLAMIRTFEERARILGLKAHTTGKSPLYMGMNKHVVNSFLSSISIALVLVSLLLIIGFKSVKLGLLAMLPNAVPLLIGGAFIKILGFDLNIGTVLVTSICLGIAVDDTIHFLAHYQRLRREGHTSIDAVARIYTHVGPALIVTTLVLVSGYASFMLGTFMPNVHFGIMVALVLSTALILDLTFLPALLLGLKDEKKPSDLS